MVGGTVERSSRAVCRTPERKWLSSSPFDRCWFVIFLDILLYSFFKRGMDHRFRRGSCYCFVYLVRCYLFPVCRKPPEENGGSQCAYRKCLFVYDLLIYVFVLPIRLIIMEYQSIVLNRLVFYRYIFVHTSRVQEGGVMYGEW